MSGTNLEHARVCNHRMTIEAMRLYGELTRARLARLIALIPQTVSNIVAGLEQMDLLTSHQPWYASGRGQPAVPMSLNPTSAWLTGIHLDHQTLIVALVDLAGEVHFRRLILVRKSQPGMTFIRLAKMPNGTRALPTLDWSWVLGMGVVMPGPSDVKGISSTGPTTLDGWKEVDIATEFGRLSGLPMTLESDAMVAVIGECFHDMARQPNSFVYPYIGTDLGAGIFTDGHMCIGHVHNANKVGHIVAASNGRPCYCGNEECLECYASLQVARKFYGLDPYRALPEGLLSADVAFFDQWITSIPASLRQTTNLLECVFDAETVVVDGMMPAPLLEEMPARLLSLYQSMCGRYLPTQRVKMRMTSTDAATLGATALSIFDEFNSQFQVLMKAVNISALFDEAR